MGYRRVGRRFHVLLINPRTIMNNITRLLFIGGLVINWSALGQRQARSLPSLRADVTDTFTRQLVDGNTVVSTTVGTFYRDQEGRTRTERGNLIVIQDPTIRVTIVLDTKAKTARQFAVGQGARASAPIPSSSSNSLRPR